jgi:hypothetical protein
MAGLAKPRPALRESARNLPIVVLEPRFANSCGMILSGRRRMDLNSLS